MSKPIQFFYILSILILASAVDSDVKNLHLGIRKQILSEYLEKGSIKNLFKAYHFIYGKTYDYNTAEGINKYKTFRTNIKSIIEHNNSDSTWKMGINHLTDMTYEEIKKYYKLKPFSLKESLRQLRGISLDDFNDDEEQRLSNKAYEKVTKENVDWREKVLLAPRHQGECGSCWAFGTMTMIEGTWGVKNGKKIDGYLSVQHLVDCDTDDNGCDGGWFTTAINYLRVNHGAIYDRDYQYLGKKGECLIKDKTFAKIIPTGFKEASLPDLIFKNLLENGPVASAIDANEEFNKYSSGIWNAKCGDKVNHAIVIVGYSETEKSWIIQNSWGEDWGEKGYMKLQDQDTENYYSCHVGKIGFQAIYA